MWGQAHYDGNIIEMDCRLKGKKHLEILNHEFTHLKLPHLEEDEVVEFSIALTNLLWKEGYRRIDNDESQPLQK